jgi:hypothetical protein
MLIGRFIGPILIVTGIITALPVLQFFFPRPMLKLLSGVTISDEAGLLFARHWGLVTLTIGALLVFAASAPAARTAIVAAVLVEKVGYAALVLGHWRSLPKMRSSGLFDVLCSALYVAYLAGA